MRNIFMLFISQSVFVFVFLAGAQTDQKTSFMPVEPNMFKKLGLVYLFNIYLPSN